MRLVPRFALLIELICVLICSGTSPGQESSKAQKGKEDLNTHVRPNDAGAAVPSRFDLLRGAYGPFRANNDLLYYHLNIRVDPEQQTVRGKNTIRFRMLQEGTRIQLDLDETLSIEKILLGAEPLKFERDTGAVFIIFPHRLRAGQVYSIDFYYSGHPKETGRFGGITFKKDPAGRTWINTACEETGASIWWPNKD